MVNYCRGRLFAVLLCMMLAVSITPAFSANPFTVTIEGDDLQEIKNIIVFENFNTEEPNYFLGTYTHDTGVATFVFDKDDLSDDPPPDKVSILIDFHGVVGRGLIASPTSELVNSDFVGQTRPNMIIDIDHNESSASIEIDQYLSYEISLKFEDQDGEPVEGLRIVVSDTPSFYDLLSRDDNHNFIYMLTTDNEGNASFTLPVHSSENEISIYNHGFVDVGFGSPYAYGSEHHMLPMASFMHPFNDLDVNVTLYPAESLTGSVELINETEKELDYVRVSNLDFRANITRFEYGEPGNMLATEINANQTPLPIDEGGNYNFRLPGGDYVASAKLIIDGEPEEPDYQCLAMLNIGETTQFDASNLKPIEFTAVDSSNELLNDVNTDVMLLPGSEEFDDGDFHSTYFHYYLKFTDGELSREFYISDVNNMPEFSELSLAFAQYSHPIINLYSELQNLRPQKLGEDDFKKVLRWLPGDVTVNVSNADNGTEYLGILVWNHIFRHSGGPGYIWGEAEEASEIDFALLNVDDKFEFFVNPSIVDEHGDEYYLLVYEVFGDIEESTVATDPERVSLRNDDFIKNLFSRYRRNFDLKNRPQEQYVVASSSVFLELRHFERGFSDTRNRKEFTVNFTDTSELTLKSEPDVIKDPSQIRVGISNQKHRTGGYWEPVWPALIFGDDAIEDFSELSSYTFILPKDIAYRVELLPTNLNLPIRYDNVVTGDDGQSIIFRPVAPIKLSGTFAFDGIDLNQRHSFIAFAPLADLHNWDLREEFTIDGSSGGEFDAYLTPGRYVVTIHSHAEEAPPLNYYAGVIRLSSDGVYYIQDGDDWNEISDPWVISTGISDYVNVQFQVVDNNDEPVNQQTAHIFRKISDRSSMHDGGAMFHYGTSFAPEENGDHSTWLQKNVDYYIVADADELEGARNSRNYRLSIGETNPAKFHIPLLMGTGITGRTNVPAFVFTQTTRWDPSIEEGGWPEFIQPQRTQVVDDENLFRFPALTEGYRYSITFYPMKPGFAVKTLRDVKYNAQLDIEFEEARNISGRLVNKDDDSLIQLCGIKVSLSGPDYEFFSDTKQGQFTFAVPYSLEGEVSIFVGDDEDADLISHDGTDYAFNKIVFDLEPGESNIDGKDLPLPSNPGRITGRFIFDDGNPVTGGDVRATCLDGQEIVTEEIDDGYFTISGLKPGVEYFVEAWIQDAGITNIPDPYVIVEADTDSDIGTIVLQNLAGVGVNISITNYKPVFERVYKETELMREHAWRDGGEEVALFGFRANAAVSEQDLVDGLFLDLLATPGPVHLIWDPNNLDDDINIRASSSSGRTRFALMAMDVLGNEEWMWSLTTASPWTEEVALPTAEQLGGDSFSLDDKVEPYSDFGSISGKFVHSQDSSQTFAPAIQSRENIAILAFHRVDDNGRILPEPFPQAIAWVRGNDYRVKTLPYGNYRVRAITNNFGSRLYSRIINVNRDGIVENFAIGGSTTFYDITGTVQDEDGEPIAGARVRMVDRDITERTDADGNFSFRFREGQFINPVLEVRATNYQVSRVIGFADLPASGFRLRDDVKLNPIELNEAPGNAVITVNDADGNPLIGAEVAMIIPQVVDDVTVYNVTDRRATDHAGVVRFSGVPVGVDVRFRARAHFHSTKTEPIEETEETNTLTIQLSEQNSRVFFNGSTNLSNGGLNLTANFDFDRVVRKDDIEVKALVRSEGTDTDVTTITGDMVFPDEIFGSVTNMRYEGVLDNKANMYIVVEWDGNEVGAFRLLENTRLRRELEVDPLAETGFTGRAVDKTGNELPIGLLAQAGYLTPKVDAFQIEVNEPEEGDVELDDGSTAKRAGPTSRFTFTENGEDPAKSRSGLFEITIEYEEGTIGRQPRYFDTESGKWSSEGIVEDSIEWDYPMDGYVTFMVDHLTEFGVFANVKSSSDAFRCDFNNDGVVDNDDLVILIAWLQTGRSSNKDLVLERAKEISSSVKGPIEFLPDADLDDLTGDGSILVDDLVILFSWLQLERTDENLRVNDRAAEIMEGVSAVNLPGESITR